MLWLLMRYFRAWKCGMTMHAYEETLAGYADPDAT